jgi:hypothetical protein
MPQLTIAFRYLVLLALFSLGGQEQAALAANGFDQPILHPAIPLVDENGRHVLQSGKPYSTRTSCGGGSGGCHDIDKIGHAYHFEMGRDEADDRYGAKRGVIPLVGPGYFGGYNCMLGNNPLWLAKKNNASAGEFLDYGAAGLIKTCAGCHNGGGFAEKDRHGQRYDQTTVNSITGFDGDYYDWQGGTTPTVWNWQQSGVMEADCLMCHADLSQLRNNAPTTVERTLDCKGMDCSLAGADPWADLRANQLLKHGHFRDANSAIFKFLNINAGSGTDRFLLDSIDNPSGSDQPVLHWNAAAFDSNGKIAMPMLRFPGNGNCMQCHVTDRQRRGFYGYGDEALEENNSDGSLKPDYRDDIHKGKSWSENGESRDIENCNACHSKQYYKEAYLNVDIDAEHNFPAGNSDQDVRRDLNSQPEPLSCEHCHNGPEFGGAEQPALPSGHDNILDAHRELWKANGDMVGYPANTLNKVTQVHLDVIACQSCHITDVQFNGQPLKLRYRYRQAEDGRLKMMPYQATPRFYWRDKHNQRLLSRQERLQVGAGDSAPQSYDEVKQLKAALDKLLGDKGYTGADSQLVWTEANAYLVTHNTRAAVQAMPCTDCHDRKANGSISSLVKPNGVLGENNSKVVAAMADSAAYPSLVQEGVVKLDMPYFKVSADGKIVENVSDILYETKITPFTTALRASEQSLIGGEFKIVSTEQALAAFDTGNALVNSVALTLAGNKSFLFHNRRRRQSYRSGHSAWI